MLVPVSKHKDERNRDIVTYIDTDEMSDEIYKEYASLCNEVSEGKSKEDIVKAKIRLHNFLKGL